MAKTKEDKDAPFGYGPDGKKKKVQDSSFTPFKVGDVITYNIGKKLGTSHGKILTISVANVKVEDYGHYRSTSKTGQPEIRYRPKAEVVAIYSGSVPSTTPELAVINTESNVETMPDSEDEKIAAVG